MTVFQTVKSKGWTAHVSACWTMARGWIRCTAEIEGPEGTAAQRTRLMFREDAAGLAAAFFGCGRGEGV